MTTFKIVRFYQDERPRRTIKRGLTKAEAQAHCQREDTHGPGWFDGWTEEIGTTPKVANEALSEQEMY